MKIKTKIFIRSIHIGFQKCKHKSLSKNPKLTHFWPKLNISRPKVDFLFQKAKAICFLRESKALEISSLNNSILRAKARHMRITSLVYSQRKYRIRGTLLEKRLPWLWNRDPRLTLQLTLTNESQLLSRRSRNYSMMTWSKRLLNRRIQKLFQQLSLLWTTPIKCQTRWVSMIIWKLMTMRQRKMRAKVEQNQNPVAEAMSSWI